MCSALHVTALRALLPSSGATDSFRTTGCAWKWRASLLTHVCRRRESCASLLTQACRRREWRASLLTQADRRREWRASLWRRRVGDGSGVRRSWCRRVGDGSGLRLSWLKRVTAQTSSLSPRLLSTVTERPPSPQGTSERWWNLCQLGPWVIMWGRAFFRLTERNCQQETFIVLSKGDFRVCRSTLRE